MEIKTAENTERGDGFKDKVDIADVCLQELCIEKKDSILEQRNVVAAKNLNWNKVHLKVKSNSILITNVNVIRLTESDSTGINDDKGSGQNKD